MKIDEHSTLETMSQALWYNRWTLKKFEHVLKGDILEIGCGIGNFTTSLTEYGTVWAFDNNKTHLALCKKKVGKRVHIGVGDIENHSYFFKRKTFDTIVCMNVLEHIKDDNAALKNMHKLLKKNGILVLLVPIHPWLFGTIDAALGHYRRYKTQDVQQQLVNAGFSISFVRTLNFIGTLGWWIAGHVRKHTIVSEGNIDRFNKIAPFVLPFEDLVEPPIGTSVLVIANKQ